jgi:hypothetical protein
MTTPITVNLPDDVYQRAQNLADMTGQAVEDVLEGLLSLSMPSLAEMDSRPVETLPDPDVLALADSTMDAGQSAHLSILLDKKQAGEITVAEQNELKTLMAIYDAGQQRKTEALVEAVKRGLRARLET